MPLTSGLTAAAGLAGSSALNLVALLIWVRILTSAQFAILILVTTTAMIANALLFEWLRLASARALPDSLSDSGIALARLAAWLRLAMILAAGLVLLTVAVTMGGLSLPGLEPQWNIAILALALSEAHLGAIALVARLSLSARRYAAIMIARSAAALLLGLALVHAGFGPAGIVTATAVAQAVVATIALRRDQVWRAALTTSPDPAESANLLRLGAPLIAGSVLALLAASIDRSLVAATLGLGPAGQFAAPAELIGKALGFAFMAVNLTAFPLLVRAWDGGPPGAAAVALTRNLRLLLALGLPVVVATILAPVPIASLLLGPRNAASAAPLLPWLASATLLRLLGSFHWGIMLQLARRMELLLLPPLAALALLVPLAAPILHAHGLVGFVRLLCAAQALGCLTAWALTRTIRTGSPISIAPAATRSPSPIATAPSNVAPQ